MHTILEGTVKFLDRFVISKLQLSVPDDIGQQTKMLMQTKRLLNVVNVKCGIFIINQEFS